MLVSRQLVAIAPLLGDTADSLPDWHETVPSPWATVREHERSEDSTALYAWFGESFRYLGLAGLVRGPLAWSSEGESRPPPPSSPLPSRVGAIQLRPEPLTEAFT